MDDNLGANDPYREMMDSAGNDIRPGFLGGSGEGEGAAKKALKGAEQAAMAIATKGGGSKGASAGAAAGGKGASGAKGALSDGAKSGAENANKKEKGVGGLYNKKGNKKGDGEDTRIEMSSGMKATLKVAAPFLILTIGLIVLSIFMLALPVILIGAIDYNLMKVLGFENTIGILEKVGEVVTSEFLAEGEVPSQYFSDLVANGIDVGQVTANGDFVRTNVYIANIEERDDLVAAASGFSYISEDEGELAMLYDGKIIYADDFVAAVESEPKLYAAYSAAADLDTKYYYGEDVSRVYKEMGISRGNFNDWESTGNYVEDERKYLEILKNVLNDGSDLAIGGSHKDLLQDGTVLKEVVDDGTPGGTYVEPVNGEPAATVTGGVAVNTQNYIYDWVPHEDENGKIIWTPQYSTNATQRAVELLNTAVSANEPYLAANAFIAIEEPIQRARIDGDGPVNQVMNTLTRGEEVSYQNVSTGGIETKSLGILETRNFRAAVSDSEFDAEEALNFSRDRVLTTTNQIGPMRDDDTIRRTTVATPGHQSANTAVRNGKTSNEEQWASESITAKANENLELSQASANAGSFQSVIGGNRAIEGGSFLSTTINMHVIAAMPSDDEKITDYNKVAEETMNRRIEAERATKSPFDISSPNTFLGSIVHNMASSILGNYGTGLTMLSTITSAGDMASNAAANIMGSAIAANGSRKFTSLYGIGCETVSMAGGVQGDLYCSSHNTVSTKYIDYTKKDFMASGIEGQLDDDGKPVKVSNGDGLYGFVEYGMDRYAPVGVKSAEVCERFREDNPDYEPPQNFWQKIGSFFEDMDSTYEVCDVGTVEHEDRDADLETRKVYTGARYSFGSDGDGVNALYSSYVMYDEVRSLLTDKKSVVSMMREEYEKEHPTDYSRAAIIARRSGMSKKEAEIALAYNDYLTMIANYNPNTRFDFTAPVVSIEKPLLEYHSDEIALELYAWYSKQTEYDDLRTRNFVV